MSSTWSSCLCKFKKKDPNHGKWWKAIKRWLCKIGLYQNDKCDCSCKGRSAAYNHCCKGTPKNED